MLSEDTRQTSLEKNAYIYKERVRERESYICAYVYVCTLKSLSKDERTFSEYSFIYSQITQLLYFFAEDVTAIGPTVQTACSV